MQKMQNVQALRHLQLETCSALPAISKENTEKAMSSNSKTTFKAERRIDMLFSKFAAFYGHVWRSQFKDEAFLNFAKKEWQQALEQFSNAVLDKAILHCRDNYELPPTLAQVFQYCKGLKKRDDFYVRAAPFVRADSKVANFNLTQCKKFLSK